MTDKHGRSRAAYNLRINIYRKADRPIILGMQGAKLPKANPDTYYSSLNREVRVRPSTVHRKRVARRRVVDPAR